MVCHNRFLGFHWSIDPAQKLGVRRMDYSPPPFFAQRLWSADVLICFPHAADEDADCKQSACAPNS
jgi:hypothetical protein